MMRKYHVRFGGGPTEKESQDHLAGGLPNYAGGGPAQLVLAILADAVGGEKARECYQRFKFEIVARFTSAGWELTREEVLGWYRRDLAAQVSQPSDDAAP